MLQAIVSHNSSTRIRRRTNKQKSKRNKIRTKGICKENEKHVRICIGKGDTIAQPHKHICECVASSEYAVQSPDADAV